MSTFKVDKTSHEYTIPGVKGWIAVPAEMLVLIQDHVAATVSKVKAIKCNDCKGLYSAVELYTNSDVPGSCSECADNFFGCDDWQCDLMHHPDDPCGE